MQRTVFFISDGTAITTETVGHSLLTQFPGITFRQQRIPFVDSPEKARRGLVAESTRPPRQDGAAGYRLSFPSSTTRHAGRVRTAARESRWTCSPTSWIRWSGALG